MTPDGGPAAEDRPPLPAVPRRARAFASTGIVLLRAAATPRLQQGIVHGKRISRRGYRQGTWETDLRLL